MTKLPDTIDVLGTDWSIRLDRDLTDDGGEWGSANARTRTIAMHPDGDNPTLIIHELIHTFEHALNFDLKESHVQGVARGLVATLKANPKLLAWLVEQLS